MAIEQILSDLAAYWRAPLGSEAFIEKLTDLAAKYPRVFDLVEERSFTQLSQFVPNPIVASVSTATTRNWVAKLNSLSALRRKGEEERQEANKSKQKQRAQQLADVEKRKAEEAKAKANVLNESRQFDLLLFDLDDTLIKSSHLDKYRGWKKGVNRPADDTKKLTDEATRLKNLIPENVLRKIKVCFPDIQLGIFTRAPRAYADVLLAICFPNIKWDSVIANEDVEKTKPSPEGIRAAAKANNVSNMRRVALVGDDRLDIIAAYQAGAFAVLFERGWGSDWKKPQNKGERNEHYNAVKLVPDAIVDQPSDLIQLITDPWTMLPTLESWDTDSGSEPKSRGTRVDEINHFNNLPRESDSAEVVKTKVMGRYFVTHHNNSRWDFKLKRKAHRVSLTILKAKDGNEYPDSWVTCCVQFIVSLADEIRQYGRGLVVCPVPARPGRPKRIERLVERIEGNTAILLNLTFKKGLLYFKDGVQSNKELGEKGRFVNIRDHLAATEDSIIAGNEIIVIDDVVTTGATFYYADRYLRERGACNVHCLALTQAIS